MAGRPRNTALYALSLLFALSLSIPIAQLHALCSQQPRSLIPSSSCRSGRALGLAAPGIGVRRHGRHYVSGPDVCKCLGRCQQGVHHFSSVAGWAQRPPWCPPDPLAQPLVKNMLLLDSEGKRIAVKYYSPEWWVLLRQQLIGAGAAAGGGGQDVVLGRAQRQNSAAAAAEQRFVGKQQREGTAVLRWAGPGLTDPSGALRLLAAWLGCRSNVVQEANYEKSVFTKTSRTNARGEGA